LTGRQSAAQLCREHQLSPNLLTVWKQKYLERLPVIFQAEEQRGRNKPASPNWSRSSGDKRSN
jgi:transposase-like protein